jgi:ABC-type thiamine transport system substrate-binding protein
MKNFLYGTLCFLFISLAFCAIFATNAYRNAQKPKVTVELSHFKYETYVNDEQEGAEVCKKFYDAIEEKL